MPRVPHYDPNRVSPATTTDARLRAASNPVGLGPSIARFGESIADFAEAQDKIDALYDDTASRKAALEFTAKAQEVVASYQGELGLNAISQREAAEKALQSLRRDHEGKMAAGRMRALFDERTAGIFEKSRSEIGSHAVKQVKLEADRTQKAQLIQFQEMAAASFDDPEKIAAAIESGLSVIEAQQELHGFGDEEFAIRALDYESGAHRAVVERMLAKGDVSAADAYRLAHEDRLNAKDELAIAASLKEPLQKRDWTSALQDILAGLEPSEAGEAVEDVTFQMPLEGKVTSRYGAKRGSRMHNGVDIAAPIGSQINPIAPGKVVTVSSDKDSGLFVVVDHGNGITSSYSHMGKQSVQVGDDVTMTSGLGVVGMTGRSTGPHVHMVVRKNGELIDPLKLVGTTGAVKQGPRRWDMGDVLGRIDEVGRANGWQFEKIEGVKALARERIEMDELLQRRSEAEADREAADIVARMGDGFTSINQLPASVRERLSGQDLREWASVADRNATPKPVAANGDIALGLQLLQIDDPEAFKSTSLLKYRGLVAPDEFEKLVLKQAEMRKPEALQLMSGITKAITYGEKFGGIEKLDDRERAVISQIMESELRLRAKSTGKLPTEEDFQAAFKSATREIKTTRWTWLGQREGSLPRYKLQTENIPESVKGKVIDRFKAVYGREPKTDDELAAAYRLGKGVHW